MNKRIFRWCLLGVTAWAFLGCHRFIVHKRIHPEEIPDGEYHVTVHEGDPLYYAVLFDIPDEKQVAMSHTYLTAIIGRDRPDEYLDRFKESVRFYRALRISEKDGTVRGYLVKSNLLAHITYKDPKGDRIMIRILDPSLRGPKDTFRDPVDPVPSLR